MQTVDPRCAKPIALTALIIVGVFGWLAFEIPKGTLSSSGDELLTAARWREMLLLGRSQVHFNLSPSFQKPPLQYWLTSLTLPRLKNQTLAVRIWPWLMRDLPAVQALYPGVKMQFTRAEFVVWKVDASKRGEPL